jgi:multidrug efflux pump subunit AcrB
MGIVRFALKFPYTFYVLAAFIVFLGVSAIMVMPEDIFPEIDIPVVSVIWQYTGLSVPEMEQRVTTYSQYSISTNVTGIKNMEAQTLNGISVQRSISSRMSTWISPSRRSLRRRMQSAPRCRPASQDPVTGVGDVQSQASALAKTAGKCAD